MSLINDALKKAQKQQNEQPTAPASPVGSTGSAPSPLLRRGTRPGIGPGVLLLGVAGLLIVMAGGGLVAVLMFRKPAASAPVRIVPAATQPATAAPAPVAAARPAATPARTPASAPVAAPPAASLPAAAAQAAPAASSPAALTESASASPSADVTTPSAQPAVPAASAVPPPAPTVQVSVAPAPPPPPPKPRRDPKILAFLDRLNVSGVRVAGSDSRVLMNNRVFRVGDMVDYVLGLRLINVTSNSLTFRDENGVVYKKTF